MLFLGKHRVTPCRKQRWAPFPARLEPLGTTRGPAFVTEPGIAMGLGAGARKRHEPLPGPPDLLLCARTDLCRSPPMRRAGPPPGARPDAGRWTGQVHQPQRRATTLKWDALAAWPVLASSPRTPERAKVRRPCRSGLYGVEACVGCGRRCPVTLRVQCPYGTGAVDWRRCEFSTPAGGRLTSTSPIT